MVIITMAKAYWAPTGTVILNCQLLLSLQVHDMGTIFKFYKEKQLKKTNLPKGHKAGGHKYKNAV